MDGLERDLADAALGQRREDLFILAPFRGERLLPVDVRLDAVAVANVYGGLTGEAVDGAMQRLDAPVLNLVHEYVEGGLVELDDVDAVLLQRARFLVQQVGEGEGHLHAVAVVAGGGGGRNRTSGGEGA